MKLLYNAWHDAGKDEVQKTRLMTKLADMKPLEQSNKAMRDALDKLCATV